MPDILQIDTDTVLIDGQDIDFAGEVGGVQTTQLAFISVQAPELPPIDLTQLVSISVQQSPPQPVFLTQAAIITVVSNARKYIALGNPIKLNCWQPCTAFGYSGIVLYLGSNSNG